MEDEELNPGTGGKVWKPREPHHAFNPTPKSSLPAHRKLSRFDKFLFFIRDNLVTTVLLGGLTLLAIIASVAIFDYILNPPTAATVEGLFVSPETSSAAAVQAVRNWIPEQEPFLITPSEIKEVVLNGILNGETGFILLKDETVIPFTIQNAENVITAVPAPEITIKGDVK